MLKIATMMYKAMQSSEAVDEDDAAAQSMDFNMNSKLNNLKAAR
jgi:hypothetical protein